MTTTQLNDIVIIADNGGGLTLQVTNATGQDWQHTYYDAKQCLDDIVAALNGDDPIIDWDGNDLDDDNINLLSVSYDDERNGSYRESDYITSLADVIRWGYDSGWGNIKALAAAAKSSL